MNDFLEIVKYTLPSLIVFITAYLIIRGFLDNETNKQRAEINLGNQRLLTPIRLQAYERLILFMERSAPEALIMRVQLQGMNAKQLKQSMIDAVRKEFEHNMSQQIYISPKAWEAVRNAKENLIKLINVAGGKIPPNANALNLGQHILEIYMAVDQPPLVSAMSLLKEEFYESFIDG